MQQQRYCMNPNYVATVKKNLNKLLATKFISPINVARWLSSMVIIPKHNTTLCMDFRKLNTTTRNYPLSITQHANMEEIIVKHEIYSFIDYY